MPHHGSAWERVKHVCKLGDPSGCVCRRVEAWTAVISLDLDLERLICHLGRSVVRVQCRNGLRGVSVNWLGQKLPEELAARSAGDGRLPEGVPKEEREYRIGGTVGRSWAAAGRNAKEGAGVPLYWRPQERWL
jgi:hypothetical protein